MSISVSKVVNLAPAAVKFLVQDEIEDEPVRAYKTIGGVFSDTDYAWLSNGPRLEVVRNKTGCKVGAWTFGWVLKDSYTKVVCVEEIQRPHGRLPLLAVGLDCDFSGGMLCIFDFITSRVIRAIQIRDKITTLHVVDAGYDVFTLPGPLRNFDGIIAVGTAGGDVFLIDICRQICDEALTVGGLSETRDELNPCLLNNITSNDISKIEFHKEFAIRNSQHLAIHLNVVPHQSTRHFTLKGPKGDDRVHVNKDEVTVSALYYCPQLGSLLIGYNFGALQLYNLMNLELVYTSPVCEEHIPISHFAIQEPADDPRAFCYVWAVYSASEQYSTCLPLAVMYAFCYHTKEYHEGYGFLYQDFNTASVHYQMELGIPQDHKRTAKPVGGYCLKLNSINQGSVNKGPHHDSNEDSLTLCALVWNVWYNKKEIDTFVCLFDLNQWYKEQMPPNAPNTQYSSTFMIQLPISNLINSSTNKSVAVIDIHIDRKSLRQFSGAQRLEEHFCPNSISFGMCCLRVSDIIHLHNFGVQKALLAQIESSGPLCLIEPAEIYQEIIGIGLIPLFFDLPVNTPITTNQQREIILGTALENQLMGWLCKCASEWANGSYLSTGCSLDLLITWAFQRAIALKTNCDNFCVPLFDHSETRLDNNTNTLLNSCMRQLKNLCSLYAFIIRKLYMFISNQDLVNEQYKSLEMVSAYFEVLQWLLNVGLLPECPLSAYPRSDDMERINAPYAAEMLSGFYNYRRGHLKLLNEENFSSSESVFFIDTLIERECGGKILQEQWRKDGGNGLYPPPSLQSLLRTYLIDNVDLSYKHSVITYVFLDLAMILDQARYKSVITYLIKFPAVFKVSPSLIKITQAFWQLDHGDYNTAMGLLLDPLILNNDLNQWHHKVALRSLLLQKQHNFALLYVQVRKPTFKDDEDVMTAISLYVANNLLDEAFHFEKRFSSQSNGDKFLLHLFKECTKNDKIRSIIYRSLSTREETCFLKYLLDSKYPNAEDLRVYYHILRSHYIEAFESHDRSVPNQIENQGLIGQESAIPRDKLVYSLKKLLPDVTRDLLNLCQKEKNSVWQQASKPAPMSVSVHSLDIPYKSSSIAVALSKARQTFNETLNNKLKVETEKTPFLRTPWTSVTSKRTCSVFITPKILDTDQIVEDISSCTPSKRLKLSPRLSSASLSASIPSKLDTPLVKRRTSTVRSVPEQDLKVATPHSILKVKNDDTSQFEDDFNTFEKLEYTPISSKKSGLGLSPRKSLAKPSPVVRFEGLKSSSSSSLNASHNLTEKLAELSSTKTSPVNSFTQRLSGSSKNTSTEEEIFYSPDNSLEESTETIENVVNEVKEVQKEEKVSEIEEIQENDINEIKETKASLEEEIPVPVFSPKARRSYKRALGSMTPVRSSPRLSKTRVEDKEVSVDPKQEVAEEVSSPNETHVYDTVEETTSSTEKTTESTSSANESVKASPSTLPKLRPRRSLCRKVLETNALNRVFSSPVASPRSRRQTETVVQNKDLRKNEVSSELTPPLTPRRSLFRKTEKSLHRQKITKTEESTETTRLESTVKYTDGKESNSYTFMKKHGLTTSFVESESDSSEECSFTTNAPVVPELLSSSMWRCINSSNKSMASDAGKDNDSKDDTVAEETHEVTKSPNNILRASSVAEDDLLQRETEEKEKKPRNDKSIDDYRTTTAERDQSAYSVYDSSCSDYFNVSYKESGPKFSESMMRCIYDPDVGEEKVDRTSNEDEEAMDVDTNEEPIKNDPVVEQEDAPKSPLKKTENEESQKKQSHENSPENGEDTKEVFDGESSNRAVDPEMNVFEISDDLSINNGVVVEKEVTFEENDLCYDQQNTLESVLEENVTSAFEENISVSSTPLKVLEKSVFNESFGEAESSEEESDVGEEQEVSESLEEPERSEGESDVEDEQKGDDRKQPEETKSVEIIEIGSSSDENEQERIKEESSEYDSERSYQHDGSDEEKLEVSYERNIYETENDYSSESSCERRYSEISENSDDSKCSEPGPGELFHGDIILVSDHKESESSDDEVEEAENKAEESNEEDKDVDKEVPQIDKDIENKCAEINEEEKEDEEMSEAVDKDIENKCTEMNEEEKEDEEMSEADNVEGQPEQVKLFSENHTLCRIEEEKEVKVDDNKSIKINETEAEGGLFHGNILFENKRDEVKDKTVVAECSGEKADENLPSVKQLEQSKDQEEDNTVTITEDVEEKGNENLSSAKQLGESQDQEEHDTVTTVETDQEKDEAEHDIVAVIESAEEKGEENLQSVKQLDESRDQEEHDSVTMTETAEGNGDETLSPANQLEESKHREECDTVTTPESAEREDANLQSVQQLEELENQEQDTVTMTEAAAEVKGDKNLPSLEQSEESKGREEHDTVTMTESAVKELEESKDQVEHDTMKKPTSVGEEKRENEHEQESDTVEKSADLGEDVDLEKSTREDEGIKKDDKVEEHACHDEAKNDPETSPESRDLLDVTIIPAPQNIDVVDTYVDSQKNEERSTVVTKPRTRSASVSGKPTKRTRQKSTEVGEEPTRRSTRRTKEVSSNKLDATVGDASTSKSDVVDSFESEPVRILRSRRVSTEENAKPTLILRKRSASVDETKVVLKESAKKEKTVEVETNRTKRAASVSRLPQITEESVEVKHVERKRSRSVLESYSQARRVTRQQLNMLKKVEGESVSNKINLDYLDPIVFLDRLPFEGKPDPEEKKVYEASPPSSNSAPMTRSKTRTASVSSVHSDESSKHDPEEKKVYEASPPSSNSAPMTRNRARSTSVSSVHSDDSNASETPKLGKRRTKLTTHSGLPGIQEESESDKLVIPKKRTRKNSSQK